MTESPVTKSQSPSAQSAVSNPQPPISFSQASLQDYVDCRRRFQLRYILRVAWPALESEPALDNERAMQQGAQFHRLIQQHLLGIPAERLTPLAQGEDLIRWWGNFLEFAPSLVEEHSSNAIFPEITLSTPLPPLPSDLSFRLLAKYDLVRISPDGQVTIFDWKTSRKRTKRQWLLERLQTRVYPYVMVQAGGFLLPIPGKVLPEQVEMIYWFADHPREPERIAYSAEQFQRDAVYLNGLIAEIARLPVDEFTLTTHEERCQFCTYRSLCNRGVKAGNGESEQDETAESSTSLDIDFEQVAEIEF